MQAELKRLSEAEQLMQMELDEKLKQYQEMLDLFDDTRQQLQGTRSELQHTQGELQQTQQSLSDTQETLHKTQVSFTSVVGLFCLYSRSLVSHKSCLVHTQHMCICVYLLYTPITICVYLLHTCVYLVHV